MAPLHKVPILERNVNSRHFRAPSSSSIIFYLCPHTSTLHPTLSTNSTSHEMLLHVLVHVVVSSVEAFVPHVSTSGYPWVTDVTPGLNWATAADCGDKFILNTYYAIGESQTLGLAAYHSGSIFSTAFEQFFGRGWTQHPKIAKDIWGNINASIWYPWRGEKRGRNRPRYQLSINCKEQPGSQRCSDPDRTVSLSICLTQPNPNTCLTFGTATGVSRGLG